MRESWHAATIEAGAAEAEILSHLLHQAGCNGIVEEVPPAANRLRLTAYFSAAEEDAATLASRLRSALAPFAVLSGLAINIVTSASNEWRENWRQWFKPFAIVPGIIVSPSWESYRPAAGEALITLDPGMAFGTGLHQTTKLCAEAIARDPRGSLLDVGTGSGLLAIIARRLGMHTIVAVENDPDALAVAEENFAINGVDAVTTAGDLAVIDGAFDIVVANILLLTLIELRDRLVGRVAPGGRLILSGITRDQEERIAQTFAPPLALAGTTRLDEWSCMTFLCPSSS